MIYKKYKKDKQIKIASITLAIVILMATVVYAGTGAVTSGAGLNIGNGTCLSGDGSGGAHLLQLVAINNTVKSDATKATNQDYIDNGKYVGDTSATLINTYRNYVDTATIFNTNRLQEATFLPRQGWSNYTPNSLALSISSGTTVEAVYNPTGYGYDGTPYGVMAGAGSRTEGWWNDASTWGEYQKLMNGTYTDAPIVWSDRSAEMADKYIDTIFGSNKGGLFHNAEAVSRQIYNAYYMDQEKVNSDFRNYVTPTASKGERVAGYTLAYYTAVVLLSEKQHNTNFSSGNYSWINSSGREMLKKYWMNRNEDGKDEFVILADMAVAGQHDGGAGRVAHVYSYVAAINAAGVNISWDTLNSWMAEKYPAKQSTFTGGFTKSEVRRREVSDNNLIREKTGFSGYSERKTWMNHYFSNGRIGDGSGLLKYSGSSTGYWTEPIGWESSLRAIDAKGNVVGPPGVCYMSGRPDDTPGVNTSHPPDSKSVIDPNNPTLSLVCEPHSTKVKTPGSDSNMVTIKVKANANSANIDKIYSYFQNKYSSKDPNSTMQIKYALTSTVDEGNPGDPIRYNVLAKGSGDFSSINNNTFLSSSTFKTRAQLNDFLTGSKSELTLQDTNIRVDDKVVITYIASMYVCMNGGGKHEDYVASPTGVNFTANGNASDTAILYTKDTPYYYSDMRHLPVSEIKADKPYGETYEAMAGVPTTTNLYLGAGATEYMVNIDLSVKTTSGQRVYTFKASTANDFGDNRACEITPCPGPLYDEKGQLTHAAHTQSCPFLGSVKADGITHHRNTGHPGGDEYTYNIVQNIDPITYMDITDEDLYRLIDFQLKGNNKLINPSNVTLNPNLGFYSYHSQEGYYNGNGRFKFSISLDGSAGQYWGNTTKSLGTINVGGNHDRAKQMVCDAINNVVRTLNNNTVTAVSDYVVLETSEGYQNVMYYEITSNNVPLSGLLVNPSNFGNHGDMGRANLTYTVQAPNITWPRQPTQQEMWDNNGNSSANWSTDHITTTGYTGDFQDVGGKYKNSNSTTGSFIASDNVNKDQPNLNKVEGDTNFQGNANKRYIKTGLNIIDSTTPPPDRSWSATDGIDPVINGEWDTGNVTVLYRKDVSYKSSRGKKWDKWTSRREAPYSEEHDKVNNVVVHNPISNKNAVVISNDSKYDQRYWGDLDKPKLPVDPAKCPNDSTCVFSTLTCTKSSPHTEACYKTIDVGLNCNNQPLNSYYTTWHWSQAQDVGAWYWHWRCSNHATDDVTYNGREPNWYPCGRTEWNLVGTTPGATYNYVNHPAYSFDWKGVNGQTYGCDDNNGKTMQIRQDHTYYITTMKSDPGWQHLWDDTAKKCLTCESMYPTTWDGYNRTNNESYHTKITQLDVTPWASTTTWYHTHTASCYRKEKVLTCTDPHHYFPNSQPHDITDPKNHYPFADSRCYTPCHDDSKHKAPTNITVPGGQQASTNGAFINIDRDFKIYYPDTGDFEQQPKLNGIADCVDEKGLGYKNNTDTDTWLRNKFVIYPFNTKDDNNNLWGAGEPIDLLKLPGNNKVYNFRCLLANNESNSTTVLFHSVANNAPEVYSYDDATSHTNFDRYTNHGAKMSVTKKQTIDVVGSIGALTIHDVGDPRFAELFKQPKNNGKWLIPNVVRDVDYSLPNKIVADDKDSRNDDAKSTGYYHSVYGITDMLSGGKNFDYVKLPLVPYKNPIVSLKKEEMRPGYNLYMDIETVGNYYGENYRKDSGDNLVPWERGSDSTGMFTYKMQIKPKYWELNLDTGKYNEVDAYMYKGSTYIPIVLTNKASQTSEYYYYLDWLNESTRRSYSLNEQKANLKVQSDKSTPEYHLRLPTNDRDVIGAADRIYLIDIDRTFIGSSKSYGVDMNTGNTKYNVDDNRIDNEADYTLQSQRWHWTLGLPSSTVFVRAGKSCTDGNIKELQSTNSVIVCSLDIKVRGSVWTLNYDGSAVNNSDGGGFKIYENGKTYAPPTDPSTGKPIDDPIVVVYNNKRTSKDDIQTQGTH